MNDAKPASRLLALLAGAAALVAPAARAATLVGDAETDLDVETVVDGLANPTDIAILPDGRLIVTQKLGDVAIVLPDGGQIDEHIDVMPLHNEQGLLGIVADPNFEQNHYLYVFASVDSDVADKHKVIRYVLEDDNSLTESAIIVDQGLYGPANHNGGGLIIDDGFLYISLGDTGENETPPHNKLGTCLNSPNGKILRVHLDGSIPDDNPLVGLTTVTGCTAWDQPLEPLPPDERIYAWGFRNPFRFWVDPLTKKLWVGDVGERDREEIAVGDGGMHFGWPFFEGTIEYSQDWKGDGCMGVTPASACVPAAHDYGHSGGRNAVMGGLILDVCGWPEAWKSRYIFGDHGSDEVWTLEVNDDRSGLEPGAPADFGEFAGPASFRVGPDQALYIVEQKGGSVQRVTPQQLIDETCAPPPGAGGMGGAGGSAGTAGMSPGGAGGDGSGGSAGASGGSAGMAAGGSAGGGTTGAIPGPTTSSDEGGCGCRAARSSAVPASMLILAGALGLSWRRRVRRR